MQRKKMLIAVLAIALLVGTTSATLLTYFGRITSTVTVSQSVKLDDLGYPGSLGITEDVSGVAGSQFHGPVHWLTNANPEIDAIVSLDSTITGGDPEGLTITPKFRLDAVQGQDNDDLLVIAPTTSWDSFVSISFEYMVEVGSTYQKTPHVNIVLRDPSTGEFKCIIVSTEYDVTLGQWNTATFTKDNLINSGWCDIGFGSINANWVLNCFTREVADGSGPITAAQVQTVWVKNPTFGGAVMYWFRVPNTNYGNIPARVVAFKMGYDFAMNAAPGIRTVRTDLTYRGTYTQGFVWTPP
jgi:hypothetical protein